MNFWKTGAFIGMLLTVLISGSSFAVTLQNLPATPQFSFDPSEDSDIPTCDEILERLQRLQKITEESQFSVIGFMEDSGSIVQSWSDSLTPLEGKAEVLAPGTFLPLTQGAEQIFELTELAYQNADYVILELKKLGQALSKCLSEPKHMNTEGVPVGLSKDY